MKESKINSIHTYSYKNNFNLNNSLLINPNNFSETLIDIIEYLSVITVNDKTLKKFTIPETVKNKFKGLTNTNIIESCGMSNIDNASFSDSFTIKSQYEKL